MFQQSGTSNQGSFPTPHDRDSSDNLRQWGRSYKDAQSLRCIPRLSRASTPSAALGALPKGSPDWPTGSTVPNVGIPYPSSRERGGGRGGDEYRGQFAMTLRACSSRSNTHDLEDSPDFPSDLPAISPAEDSLLFLASSSWQDITSAI